MRDNEFLIELDGIARSYPMGNRLQPVLSNVSLAIRRAESCAILGTSGSGKSTLLNLLGLLDRPSAGRLWIDGRDMASASAAERAQVRNRSIGFVFQSFNLLPRLSALDNVALPLMYRGSSRQAARRAAVQGLTEVGLADRLEYRPADLSGGQRQRVAIARALIGKPSLILADEPTGNLDGATARDILQLLLKLNREQQVTLVIVTHDPSLAATLQRCIRVQDGTLTELSAHDA